MNGITVDDMNMLRIGDPDVTEVSVTLNELCEQFTANVGTLSEHLTAIQEIFKQIGELADREKIVVMNAQNELKMVQTNQNNSKDVMKVQGKVQEKTVELEQSKRQLENLKQIYTKQTDYLRKLQSLQ